VLSHDKVWAAIDALASQNGLSPSGLARLAGLDPTTFNPSKRVAGDGRPRWPSTESLAKVLAATGEALVSFANRVETPAGSGSGALALIPVADFPSAQLREVVDRFVHQPGIGGTAFRAPERGADTAFALRVSGDTCLPLYRNGDIIIASPSAPARSGDRLLVQPRQGTLGLFELVEMTENSIEARPVGEKKHSVHFPLSAIAWSARIIWASQ
jgi:phage repressor protein C with HTH and peptisase S24 domain